MSNYENITPQDLEKQLQNDKAVLVDVREPMEYKTEHIDGAINMPLSTWDSDKLKTLDAKSVVLHCASGNRSCQALDKVAQTAHDMKLYNLDGGIKAWKEAELPTEKSDTAMLPLDRQVQVTLGILLLIFGLLGFFAHTAFFIVPLFIGAGLLNAGLTGWCGMGMLVAKMPWNKAA